MRPRATGHTHLHGLRGKEHAEFGGAVDVVVHHTSLDLLPEQALDHTVGELVVDRLWEKLGFKVQSDGGLLLVQVLGQNLQQKAQESNQIEKN